MARGETIFERHLIMRRTFKAALTSALLIATSPAFAAGGDHESFAMWGVGSAKCKTALKEMGRSQAIFNRYIVWIDGMVTGFNSATPGLKDMNPETKIKDLYLLVLKQCNAEPTLFVGEAALKVFKRLSDSEGSWAKAAAGNPEAERVD
jgi:hypothetical protein